MFKRRKWNNGICRQSGQPWVFIRCYGFRGASTSSRYHLYSDGCGNFLHIDAFSKVNKEYESRRTPEITVKEHELKQKDEEERSNRSGYYAPSQFDAWWDRKWKQWDIFWEPRKKWEWPIRLSVLGVLLASNFALKSCKQTKEGQRQPEKSFYSND